jgi:hypothetical protein
VWTVLSVLLSVLFVVVGATVGTYLVLTGDSGARMVFGG